MRVRNDLRHQRCPACGAPSIAKIGDVPIADSIAYSTHVIALDFVPETWSCRSCASWFTQNAIPAETARSLYATGSSGERWAAEPFEHAKCPELISEFSLHVGSGTRLLDVGCSDGQLLDFARSRGADTWGVDFSSTSAKVIEDKGHRYSGALSELGDRQFDVVTAFDLVEHLYDLPGFLAAAARLLRADGKLIVLTGDVRSLSARICGSRWWYASYPEHIVFPSRRYLRSQPSALKLVRTVRTFASVGYRAPLGRAIRTAISMSLRGDYAGLPSLGPDHLLAVMRRD